MEIFAREGATVVGLDGLVNAAAMGGNAYRQPREGGMNAIAETNHPAALARRRQCRRVCGRRAPADPAGRRSADSRARGLAPRPGH